MTAPLPTWGERARLRRAGSERCGSWPLACDCPATMSSDDGCRTASSAHLAKAQSRGETRSDPDADARWSVRIAGQCVSDEGGRFLRCAARHPLGAGIRFTPRPAKGAEEDGRGEGGYVERRHGFGLCCGFSSSGAREHPRTPRYGPLQRRDAYHRQMTRKSLAEKELDAAPRRRAGAVRPAFGTRCPEPDTMSQIRFAASFRFFRLGHVIPAASGTFLLPQRSQRAQRKSQFKGNRLKGVRERDDPAARATLRRKAFPPISCSCCRSSLRSLRPLRWKRKRNEHPRDLQNPPNPRSPKTESVGPARPRPSISVHPAYATSMRTFAGGSKLEAHDSPLTFHACTPPA